MAGGQALPVLYVAGTHYEVGYKIGVTFAERIRSFWNESTYLHTIDIPFSKTSKGRAYFESTLEVCKNNFPDFVRELQGIADGAGMPFDNIFMLNISKEVQNVLSDNSLQQQNATETAGCTDVIINSPTCKLIGHNEDCDPKIKPYGYIVSARILDAIGKEVESFTAYCYPGFLAGTALSFNKSGMVFTVDGLYTDFVVHGASPRIFLNRSIIRARTFEEAVKLIKNNGYGVAYGFTVNIADVKSPRDIWSVEVCPQAKVSVIDIQTISEVADPDKNCHYIHCNNFLHLKTSEIPNLVSSVARQTRAEEFPAPKKQADVLAILGDETNQEYPIYRTVRPTDYSSTSFTGIVDILHNRVEIYVENPILEGVVPLIHFNIM
ncbi:unnamed protein product [Candidula unifasciata]|uniref:Peptidase C45 hydrolase domain-containing protein n=1 Tax=Candidula unifasciata TaxID=100452 RepID=A0A8S3YQC9_9EUPU|nr:unnamed protein product [Candidula unifasciata]